MKNVEIIATKKSRSMKPGTRKTMAANLAKVLVLDEQAVYAEASSPAPAPERTKRTYKRRDMVAQQPAAAMPQGGPVGAMTAPTYQTKAVDDDV